MGYSGLIYAAIVAAWAAFLVPRWVRRNEEVDRARETDAARGVRVLQRRSGPAHAPHAVVEVPVADPVRPTASVDDSFGVQALGPDARRDLRKARLAFASAAARRRRILVVLVGVTGASLLGVLFSLVPWFVPAVVAGVLTGFLVAARRAAVAQSRRERLLVRRAVARAGAIVESAPVEDVGALRKLILPAELVQEPVDPNAWQPIPVPLPTYVTKATAAPRPTRTINLSTPGSWTSGRLDPAASIELPRRDPAAPIAPAATSADTSVEADELPEHRRAVGD